MKSIEYSRRFDLPPAHTLAGLATEPGLGFLGLYRSLSNQRFHRHSVSSRFEGIPTTQCNAYKSGGGKDYSCPVKCDDGSPIKVMATSSIFCSVTHMPALSCFVLQARGQLHWRQPARQRDHGRSDGGPCRRHIQRVGRFLTISRSELIHKLYRDHFH